MDLPLDYSPLVLPDFNEEELLKERTDEVSKKSLEVACNLDRDAVEASAVAEDSPNL